MSERRICRCCHGSGVEPPALDGAALLQAVAATYDTPLTFTVAQLRKWDNGPSLRFDESGNIPSLAPASRRYRDESGSRYRETDP
jgi:hypothetical protein